MCIPNMMMAVIASILTIAEVESGGNPADIVDVLTDLGAICVLNKDEMPIRVDLGTAHEALSRDLIEDLSVSRGLRELNMSHAAVTDTELACIRGFHELEIAKLNFTSIGDRGVAFLGECRRLVSLQLEATNVGTTGLQRIHARNLAELTITGACVDDRTVARVTRFRALKKLAIGGCGVTDNGIEILREMKTLNLLLVQAENVSMRALMDLQRSLPDCTVIRGVEFQLDREVGLCLRGEMLVKSACVLNPMDSRTPHEWHSRSSNYSVSNELLPVANFRQFRTLCTSIWGNTFGLPPMR